MFSFLLYFMLYNSKIVFEMEQQNVEMFQSGPNLK